ncbi:MAG: exonuclease domain-containing protein [Candidatus Pacebacteria bacterium]|jgi:DNA polymerase III epsilon subunit-like protein|nr:exonuclease domain-containing protein [Candidatus Paceibacterota bacterium]
METFLFFDTETTGNTPEDTLCQVAYKNGETTFSALYKPAKSIPPEASAVHHITNRMVSNKPVFTASDEYKNIRSLFESSETIPVAHNAKFDVSMLAKEGIIVPRYICTLRLARHLDEESVIPRYNLQYLRYYLDIDVEAPAHDALGDVIVLEQLFARLYKKYIEKMGDKEKALAEMLAVSARPSFIKVFSFGKYNGEKVEDVVKKDPGYLEWLYKQKKENESDEEDWLYTLEKALGK